MKLLFQWISQAIYFKYKVINNWNHYKDKSLLFWCPLWILVSGIFIFYIYAHFIYRSLKTTRKRFLLNFYIHATSITHRQSPVSVLIKSSHPVSGTDVRLMFCHTQPLKYMLFWHHFALFHPNKYVMLSIRNGLNCIVLNNLTAAKCVLVLMTVSRGCSQRQIHNFLC